MNIPKNNYDYQRLSLKLGETCAEGRLQSLANGVIISNNEVLKALTDL